MKVKDGYEDWCYSLFDDGFWYSLTDGENISTPEGLNLEDEGDAERVLEALNTLKEYQSACEALAEKFQEEGYGYDEGDEDGEDDE
jgi:hypothetical protein